MTHSKTSGEGQTEVFKVLSLDGGGVRGIFAAKILSLIEKKLQLKTHEAFDLIVGTSTGSIIAGSIAVRYDLAQLVEDYHENAPKIFQKRFGFCRLWHSKYNCKILEEFLYNRLGDIKLGEIEKPLILNATNVSIGDVYIFKSSYQKKQRGGDYVRDGNTPLFKAVLASCAAPTYFDPVNIGGTLVCDGGIWANNPSLVAYTDARKNFQAKKIKILSLGTGKTRKIYLPSKRWGYLSGWKKGNLVDFAMLCQTTFPQKVLELLHPDDILRINPEIENYELDDCQNVPKLIELAKGEFVKRASEIAKFLH